MVQILKSLRLQSAFSIIPLQDRVKSNIKKLNEQSAAAGGKTDSKDAPKKPASLSPFESMLYTNLSGAIIALVFCVLTDQVRRARQAWPNNTQLADFLPSADFLPAADFLTATAGCHGLSLLPEERGDGLIPLLLCDHERRGRERMSQIAACRMVASSTPFPLPSCRLPLPSCLPSPGLWPAHTPFCAARVRFVKALKPSSEPAPARATRAAHEFVWAPVSFSLF